MNFRFQISDFRFVPGGRLHLLRAAADNLKSEIINLKF